MQGLAVVNHPGYDMTNANASPVDSWFATENVIVASDCHTSEYVSKSRIPW
jgi:hypothetical protein